MNRLVTVTRLLWLFKRMKTKIVYCIKYIRHRYGQKSSLCVYNQFVRIIVTISEVLYMLTRSLKKVMPATTFLVEKLVWKPILECQLCVIPQHDILAQMFRGSEQESLQVNLQEK